MIRVGIAKEPLDVSELLSGFSSPEDGAVLLFLGVVRNQNDGREVVGLEYEAYAEMGEVVLEEIAREAAALSGSDRILVHHRVGALTVGEVSTVIAVATPHREEAYEASRFVIEELKRRLPVWKKENYAEGEAAWVKGHVPEGSAAEAREGEGEK